MKNRYTFPVNEKGFYYPWVSALLFMFLLVFGYMIHTYYQNMELNQAIKKSYQTQRYYQSVYDKWTPFIISSTSFPLTIRRPLTDGEASVTCNDEEVRILCTYTVIYKDLHKNYKQTYKLD
ncbi:MULTISPECIES: hypothetical protein [Salimicrobium]|uniref:Uncharacterized protein n=3 Tax=Salimicrobium TaxID=351195 RepID=K2GDD9_9BACI|nr:MULTISPECIES: hypothetical protein [Salimicrobium]AKG04312.1 hypothetical protein AAV35_005620 [Salimicrobium jeotgali]EKE32287.1 hypothetical protein MJ3_04924 [Salimicrobium jeotgali]MBM7695900.1 hypothetical protein [Salimicrobium jeotgali]SDX69196.1 hypothetical protein SAMN04488081_1079 [Salimicrobium album]SIS53559.1 hypothetical protein SAMN05421758_102226 [Salimicrobium salexigens]